MRSVYATNDYPKINGRIGINGNRKRVPTVTVVEAISTSKSNPEAYTTVSKAGGIRDSNMSTWIGSCDRVEKRIIGRISRGMISWRIAITFKAVRTSDRENLTPTPRPTEISARYVVRGEL